MAPSMPSSTLSFAALLKRHRKAARLTQAELAERAGFSTSYISMLERGERVALPPSIELLAQTLELSASDHVGLLAASRLQAAARADAPLATQSSPARPVAPAPADSTVERAHSDGQMDDSAAVHTFLIADVRGYTRHTVEHGDEEAARLASRFATLVRDTVGQYNGRLLELRGDEALVVFASSRQALRAAIALQARFATETPSALPVGIGLDAGEAIPVKEGGYRGAALNLAARLCSLAAAGEVLASEGVAHLARKVEGLAYHDRGTVSPKGFDDPVHVLRILSASTPAEPEPEPETPVAAAAQPASAQGVATARPSSLPLGGFLGALPTVPLVARQAELDQIVEQVASAAAGAGRLVLLAGEAGVGKTRLAQEVTLALRDREFALGVGRCYVQEQAVAYYPFINALAMLFTSAPSEVGSQVPARWPHLARLLPYQLSVPATVAPPEADPASNQEAQQQRLLWEVTSFIQALAERHPVAILLDDLHWADSASLALLKHLARHTGAARVLMLGTYRDAEVAQPHPLHAALQELGREHLFTRVTVQRLSPEGTSALAAMALGAGEVSAELASLLHEQTDGNAFFTQELLRELVERGDVYQENGRWLRRAREEIEVPVSVRGAVAERLSRLSERTQAVLNEASVLGQRFTFDDVQAVQSRPEEEVETALAAASAAGLVREFQPDQYAFRHALIQQALYAELPTRLRRRLHRAVGEALERLAEPVRERRVAELAFHYARSDNQEKALTYLMAAAGRAHAAAAHHEEAALLGQAIEIADRLEQGELAVELHCQRGHAFAALDHMEGATTEFVAALERNGLAPEHTQRRIDILVFLAEVRFFDIKAALGRPYAEEALMLAERLGHADLIARASAAVGLADTSDGDVLKGQEKFRQAFAYLGTNPVASLMKPIDQYGTNLYYTGQFAEAADHIQHVLDFGRNTHDSAYIPRALGNLLLIRAAQGRYADALALFDGARQFAREYGAGRWIARAIAMWGGVHLEVGDFAEAEVLAEEARELGRSVEFAPVLASTGLDLLFNFTRRHEVGHTESLLDPVAEAVARAQGVHGWLWRLRLAQARAEIALARGEHEQALGNANEAIAKSQATGRVKYQIMGLVTRGQTQVALGRKRQGIADLRRAVELARELGSPITFLRALAALLERDGDDASLAEAKATVQTIATALPNNDMRRAFQAGESVRLVTRLTT